MSHDDPHQDWEAYVRAASALHGVALDDERRREVAVQLQRIHAIARALLDHPLPDDVEPAPVFRP
jgi:hypothetical protein